MNDSLHEARMRKLAALIEENFGGDISEFEKATHISQERIDRLIAKRVMHETIARQVVAAFDKPSGWLDKHDK